MTADCAVCGAVQLHSNGRDRAPRCRTAKQIERGRLANGKGYQRPILGTCPICRRKALLVYDHDHATGDHRGMICRRCNCMLGFAHDSTDNLLRAVQYLSN